MKLTLVLPVLTLGLASLLFGGCTTDTTEEPSQENGGAKSSTEDALEAELVGGFHFANGATPVFKGITFLKNGTFFADVAGERIGGRFSTTGDVLKLVRPPNADPSPYYAEYTFTFKGQKLTLSKASEWSNELTKKASYCADAVDCIGQQYLNGLAPESCAGDWECGAQRTCAWVCN